MSDTLVHDITDETSLQRSIYKIGIWNGPIQVKNDYYKGGGGGGGGGGLMDC